MANMHNHVFTPRQTMRQPDFECYHYLDTVPPVVDFHEHPFYEVFFFLSGDVRYTIEGRTYQLRPGDILLTGSRDIHRPDVRPGKAYERYVIWIHPSLIDRLRRTGDDLAACFADADARAYKLVRPDSAALTQLKTMCDRTISAQRETGFGSGALSLIYLIEFLIHLNRAYFATPEAIRRDVTENSKVNEAVAYINAHLAEDLSLDRLSRALYVSKSHLNRSFKEYTGLTLYQYIIKKRLVAARSMLREGAPVMEACMKCGFNDYSNFLKAFKREFGKNPREFLEHR